MKRKTKTVYEFQGTSTHRSFIVMLKKSIFGKSVSAVLTVFVIAGTGLSSVSAFASTIHSPDTGNPGADYVRSDDIVLLTDVELPLASGGANKIIFPPAGRPGNGFGRPDHIPPVNPPIDTPAFYNGLVNAPVIMPASVPYHTLPGSGFGKAVVPVPATAWLFGSGLLGLTGIARRKKAA